MFPSSSVEEFCPEQLCKLRPSVNWPPFSLSLLYQGFPFYFVPRLLFLSFVSKFLFLFFVSRFLFLSFVPRHFCPEQLCNLKLSANFPVSPSLLSVLFLFRTSDSHRQAGSTSFPLSIVPRFLFCTKAVLSRAVV